VGLRDLGADVIKVEPLAGDVMRNYFLKFTASSRGKRIIALDLKQERGREIAERLCRSADIVHHNFRPGVTARLGIAADRLVGMKPGLVVLETFAYGLAGPRALQSGFDMTLQAFCGHEFRGCGAGNEPDLYRLPIIDFAAGLMGTLAMLAAWLQRVQSKQGCVIRTSLLNCGLHLLFDLVQDSTGQFLPAHELNHDQTGCHPAESIYPARDEWIAIAARGQLMAERLLDVLDLAGTVRAPREDWGDAEQREIATAVRSFAASDLLQRLKSAGVWATACRQDAKEKVLDGSAFGTASTVLETDDPQHGVFRQLGPQYSMSRSPGSATGASPRLGEHTRQILAELGYSESDINQLFADRVVA
jgi:crotonobetainyl-CoA:carnitine CoA-transferase CaiB-like acyl-CoA transferase